MLGGIGLGTRTDGGTVEIADHKKRKRTECLDRIRT